MVCLAELAPPWQFGYVPHARSSIDATPLDRAIRNSAIRGTYYWYFLGKRGKSRRRPYQVEVRVDLPEEVLRSFLPPDGWVVARLNVARGMVFLRRRQELRDKDLRAMFAEVLTFASKNGGHFHSWMHEPLRDWQTIFMPLLDEGTDVWRPVEAVRLSDGCYRVLDENPTDESWAFPPGSKVRAETRQFSSGDEGVAAVALAD
jgi:hypothetical protein